MQLSGAIPVQPLIPFERTTIPGIFFGGIDRFVDAPALLFKREGSWRPVTYREVGEMADAMAAALDVAGIGAGDRVAILSENRPEWAVVDYAVVGLGAVDVPLYPTLPANQLAYILNDCSARLLFVSSVEQLEKARTLLGQVSSLEGIVVFDDVADTQGARRYSDLLEAGRGRVAEGAWEGLWERSTRIQAQSLATLIYTSGTTGSPKGVMLSHENLASMVAATAQHGSIDMDPGQVALSMLPPSHIFERAVDYFYWDSRVTIAYAESIKNVADDLLEVRPHAMVSVPRLFEKVYSAVMSGAGIKLKIARWAERVGAAYVEARMRGHKPSPGIRAQFEIADRIVFAKLRKRVGGRIRTFISGGAPLDERISRFFYAAGLPIHEGYGLTETSPVLTANRPGQVRFGTVGVPYPGVILRIGEDGEILARGPNVMMGYWNNPEMTAEAIDAEGWFHTGDIGTFDEDGFLTITDRLKDLIVTAGGKNIAPQPIERHATLSPFVSQAVLIGDRRPYPILLIVPDWERLSAWAREQGVAIQDRLQAIRDIRIQEFFEREVLSRFDGFAGFEIPKKLSVLAEEFTVELGTMTPTLKVKRRVVEQYYQNLIEQLYADHGALQFVRPG